ncbi:N-acetylmuramoyl-L-alanine amidase [Candidatus Pacearchaeota archaeon]|nr:N-acetylmuramoyl-L-alanine amidase [Candidatus Pacearchaeota archaeon]
MRDIKRIIIHCSATGPGYDIGVEEIRLLHTAPKQLWIEFCGRKLRGRGWDDIGYHRIIRRDGTIEDGRMLQVIGAHTLGENHDSVGVCMVGGIDNNFKPDCNFTALQWTTLENEVFWLKRELGGLELFGHRDFANKACPTFDVKAWGD